MAYADETVGSGGDTVDHGSTGQEDRIARDLFCPECSYNLRGLSDERCPECGTHFDRATLDVSRIPWVHRRELGTLRAYWRTVWLVILPGSRFYQEAARPVSYADAQRFRWFTILHAFAAVCLVTTCAFILPVATSGSYMLDSVPLHVASWTVVQVCVFLSLAAVTGVSSYFFHPRYLPVDLQDRTVAMSYYAFATLAWTPVAGVMAVAAMGFSAAKRGPAAGIAALLACIIVLAQILLCWFDLLHIANKAMHASSGRLFAMGVALPLSWLVVGAAVLGGIPFIMGYVALMIVSLADG